MAKLGDIKHGCEIGKIGTAKYIFAACPRCGKQRWITCQSFNQSNGRCGTCAQRQITRRSLDLPSSKHRDTQGYIRVAVPKEDFFYQMTMRDRNSNRSYGWIKQSRFVMAQHLGRCLHSWEIVHHKNGIKDDDRIENLQLLLKSDHDKIAMLKEVEIIRLNEVIKSLKAEIAKLKRTK